MQAAELTKALFNQTEVRIFGTIERPLFVANDIAKLLDIKNVRDSISKFEDYEKEGVAIADTLGGMQTTTVLTEAGLYSLILKSRKPVAKEFKKWVLTEVLPTIRKTGNFSLQDNIENQRLEQLERDLEESRTEIELLKLDYKPKIEYQDVDFNEFSDDSCIYLIHVVDDLFKFGVSNGVDERYMTHFYKFRKLGYDPIIVKIWKCNTAKIMKNTELKIKSYARQNKILVNAFGQTEIMKTDSIKHIREKIDRYVNSQNNVEIGSIEIKKMELSNRNLELQLEIIKAQTEYHKQTHMILPTIVHANKIDIPIVRRNQVITIEDSVDSLEDNIASGEDIDFILEPEVEEIKHTLANIEPVNAIEKFKCQKCDKIFKKQADFDRHANRKTSCVIKIPTPDEINNPNRCEFCNKVYSKKDNLTRHLKSCKFKK